MNARISLLLASLLIAGTARLPAETSKTSTPAKYADIYQTITQQLARDSSFFGEPDESPAECLFTQDLYGTYYETRGKALLHIDAHTGKLLFLNNYGIEDSLRKDGLPLPYQPPQLDTHEALARAQAYLKNYDITLPTDVRIRKISYGFFTPGTWSVSWERHWQGYPMDDFDDAPETLGVSFNEQHGLMKLSNRLFAPAPKSFDVRVTREEAIHKAWKLTDEVMRTPHYRAARLPGFKAMILLNCELKVAVPNWLLDPERAIWIPDKPAKETRLAWVVTIETMDTMRESRPLREDGRRITLKPPVIAIYIDAATGECIGASFS
jgi:hypothetical protein